jgi:protease-4
MPTNRGVWIVVSLMFLAGVAVLFGVLTLQTAGRTPVAPAVLVFEVPDEIAESEPPRRGLPLGWGRRSQRTVLRVLQALDRAATDDQVHALVLHIGSVSWGWGRVAEMRDAILRFRASGKPVYAALAGGGEAEYCLASAADVVAAPPTAILHIDGLTASALFLRGAFDKLDVTPNFSAAGRFKSGAETFTRGGMSPPAREALSALLDDVFETLVDTLATARRLPRDSVLRIIDGGPYAARAARAVGLVDTVLHTEDVDSLALRRAGRFTERMPLYRYAEGPPAGYGPRVAVVAGAGSIVPGRSRYVAGEGQVIGAETWIAALREARTRRGIKAVVLRIDSPGGVLDAADDIWREVRRCRDVKPVYVSMSDLAASGGYYIAAPATGIVAHPGTITGSIGVYAGKLNLLGLYRKLGLNVETVSRGARAEMLSPFRDFTPEEASLHQRTVQESYGTFLDRVADGRGFTLEEADSVGQGRVWSGRSAWELGLVDTLGGIPVACELALEAAGYEIGTPYVVEVLPRVERTMFDRLLEEWLGESETADFTAALPPAVRAWITAAGFPAGRMLAMLPWSIDIR